MNIANLTIELIPVKGLVEFSNRIESDPIKYSIAPIDPYRAKAHANNPVASDEDAGMVIAYSEGKCIGYIGMMPMIAEIDGNLRKVLAPTTQFVHPDFRKKSPQLPGTVADMMYMASFETGLDQMITGFNEAGERIYRRRPEWFVPLNTLNYLRIKLTPLQPIKALLRRSALLLGETGSAENYKVYSNSGKRNLSNLLGNMLRVNCDKGMKSLRLLKTTQLGKDVFYNFKNDARPCFPRPPEVINWMIANPWHEARDDSHPRYHFHNPRQRFGYVAYNIQDNKEIIIGYLVLYYSTEKRYTTVKILDYYCSAPDADGIVLNFALEQAIALGANQIECSSNFLQIINSNKLLHKLTSVFERKYFMYLTPDSPFRGRESQVALQYCDGERPFI